MMNDFSKQPKLEYYQYSHVGKFNCPNCGFGNNDIYKLAYNVDLKNRCFNIDDTTHTINGNSIYLIYNYTAVASVCSLYNIPKEFISFFASPTVISLSKNIFLCGRPFIKLKVYPILLFAFSILI